MTQRTIRVLLVDDNRRLMSAWERLLSQQADMKLVGTLERADALLDAVRTHTPDVVLIDLTMDGRDALEAIAELRREAPQTRALVYSGLSRSEWHSRVLQAGAQDFLDKGDDPAQVLQAIRKSVPPP